MIQQRYEKYESLTNNLPFILNADLVRTNKTFSAKQNWHDNIEIQLCVEGEGAVLIDGKEYAFYKNDIIIIDSNSIHYTFSKTSITYSCIIISTEFCKQMGIDYDTLSFSPVVKDEKLQQIFHNICNEYKNSNTLRTAKLNKLLLEILIHICSFYSTTKKTALSQSKNLNAVKSALYFIRENYNKKFSLNDVSKYILIDKFTLCKEFKKFTGQTIFDNLNTFRCTKAADLLSSGKSVSETAYLCGFENISFFTKTFKKYMHTLPSKHKNKIY